MSELPTYVPLGTLAEKLSLAEITLRNWLREGKIPKHTYIKVGNTYRFNFEAVEKELLACTQEQSFEESIQDPTLDVELEAEENNPFLLDDQDEY